MQHAHCERVIRFNSKLVRLKDTIRRVPDATRSSFNSKLVRLKDETHNQTSLGFQGCFNSKLVRLKAL